MHKLIRLFSDAAKPALVFSNSLGTNRGPMLATQIDFFQQDFFVICYSTRGHGASSAPQGPYSIDDWIKRRDICLII